jgi:NAD(P)-dependent dehydrogenase (short-subunit alcohol dehydrogenase family)
VSEASVRDRVAVVTGASSSIGAAVAEAFAHEGAHIALAAHRRDALLEVRAGLEREDGGSVRSVIVPTDVTDRGQVGSLGSRAEEELGPVDLLVNCAGDIYYFLVSFPKYTTTQSQVPCPTRRRRAKGEVRAVDVTSGCQFMVPSVRKEQADSVGRKETEFVL